MISETSYNTHFAASLPAVATPILLRGKPLRGILYRATTSQSAERCTKYTFPFTGKALCFSITGKLDFLIFIEGKT